MKEIREENTRNPLTLALSLKGRGNNFSFHRIKVLLIKELAQIRRDRSLLGILIVAPVFQLLIMGFAANTDIRNISVSIRDNDHSTQSREYVRSLAASGYFKTTLVTGPESGDGY